MTDMHPDFSASTTGNPAADDAAPVEVLVGRALDELETRYRTALETASRIAQQHPDYPLPRYREVTYPQITVTISRWEPIDRTQPYGYVDKPGRYTAPVTRPELYRDYLHDQLTCLLSNYPATIEVSDSRVGIAPEYLPVNEHPHDEDARNHTVVDDKDVAQLIVFRDDQGYQHNNPIPRPSLDDVNDGIIDGDWEVFHSGDYPLLHFLPQRVDIALARLRHYTGNPVSEIQKYILFTNYAMHTEQFVHLSLERLRHPDSRYLGVRLADGSFISRDDVAEAAESAAHPTSANDTDPFTQQILSRLATTRQMPRVDLIAPDNTGVTLINIGVGPSNAKTMTDCLAVLRPECWIMIGHCAGLDGRMRLGDLILGNAYQRHDNILDRHLNPDIPIPAIPEVQRTLEKAVKAVYGTEQDVLRTGTVLSTDDRNWEWHTRKTLWQMLTSSSAVAVDMESATLAANGYRYRIPYGTLLSVSDLPLHDVPKLPAQAQHFYQSSKRAHVECALKTVEKLAEKPHKLHTRKLRRTIAEIPLR